MSRTVARKQIQPTLDPVIGHVKTFQTLAKIPIQRIAKYDYELIDAKDNVLWRIGWTPEQEFTTPIFKAFRLFNQHCPDPDLYDGVAREKLKIIEESFQMVSLWFLKEELRLGTDKDYPFCRPVMKFVKPLAKMLLAELEVCQFIHDNLPKGSTPYTDHWEQWIALMIETKDHNHHRIGLQWERSMKGEAQRQVRNYLMQYQNPSDPCNPMETHHFNFYETAIALAKPDKGKLEDTRRQFNRGVWKDLLSAYSRWATMEARGVKGVTYELCFDKGERLLAQQQNGTRQIYPEISKKTLSQRGKYTRNSKGGA